MIEYRCIVSTVRYGRKVEQMAGVVAVPESLPSDGADYPLEREAELAEEWGRAKFDGLEGWKFERMERVR